MIPSSPDCKHDGEWESTYGCDSCHYCKQCYASKEQALEEEVARLRAVVAILHHEAVEMGVDWLERYTRRVLDDRSASANPEGS